MLIKNSHAVPNLKALPPIPDNLNSPLLYDLSAATPIYVLQFVWLRGDSLIGLLEALQYRTGVRNLIARQLVLVFFDWATSE